MQAVHWLRSRQEERELIYWLSIASYDVRDRSVNNRIYLLYLIVFFSIWIFMTLTLFASAGARDSACRQSRQPRQCGGFPCDLDLERLEHFRPMAVVAAQPGRFF